MFVEFPYLKIYPKNYAPIVPIEIFSNQKWIGFEVYIDTGASFTIFHSDRAEILGINYISGRVIYVTVGDGGLIPVYLHKLPVRFARKEFNATIGFSKQLGVGFNLLGRKDFFNFFQICFNDKDKVIRVTAL